MPISVVIPVLNERASLPDNLTRLGRDPWIAEIIVVDGGSTDGSREVVRRCDRAILLESEKGRGRQMNLGAGAASAEWLLFHHADSRLPNDAGKLITSLPAEVQWGGFRHSFSEPGWKLRFVSLLHNFRCRQTGVIYGDQSMFVRREFFELLGGFPEEGIEDLVFSDAALAVAPSHVLDATVVTDSRKFVQMGEFRALAHVLSIILRYQLARRIGNEAFFRNYR